MNSSKSTSDQFQMSSCVIDCHHRKLVELPFDKLSEIARNQGKDPQEEVRGVSEAVKKYVLIGSILDSIAKNYNPITEERYQFVEWLYRIRTQYKRMGLFQPDFICIIFGKMMVSKLQRSDADIHEAVDDWCDDPAKAIEKYGHISKWNTSLVTNMKELFKGKNDFNDDISKWDVSSVTDMSNMFAGKFGSRGSFDGDISGWDVSSVTNMEFMFISSQFDGDISEWDVSSVINMDSMFSHSQFDGNISGWDVSSVTNMCHMFSDCPIHEYHKPFVGEIDEE